MIDISWVQILLSVVSGAFAILTGYAAWQQRRGAPIERLESRINELREQLAAENTERWERFETWKAHVEEVLGRDTLKIDEHDEIFREIKRFERLMLKTQKGLIAHFQDGNHTNELKALTNEIDQYLIDRDGA
ncbi:MAG: hypothetical protein LBN30_05555 [Oscillospiraceae bacterium]|jgi:hypothetical protein|nr:hypothetical protein [Oscillospiraceae bacterium]